MALLGKPKGERKIERSRHRWNIILKLIFKNWIAGMDWIDLSQDRDR